MVDPHQQQNYLRLLPMGGIDNVTKNMFIWESNQDILVIDCGIGFPDDPGSEASLELPDFSYLLTHRDKVRGVVITHAHFDHYGAVPELLNKINLPVYCSPLTAEFIKKKAEEFGLKPKNIDFHLINHRQNQIKIGSFSLTPFHVNHSVPEALGLFLQTPLANICHVSDYKFDWTPVEEKPFAIQKAGFLAQNSQPLLLMSDCLGSTKAGHTMSEAIIQENFARIIAQTRGMVLITTVTSNISRMKQAILASIGAGRKVSFLGRSMEESANIAQRLGYFAGLKKHLVKPRQIKKIAPRKLTVLVAGSYAQSGSALQKISLAQHRRVKLHPNDTVIFSADPSPPGVIVAVNKMVDNLTRIGAQVYYYELQENLYVSGHSAAEDIKMLFALIKPKYLLPIGGDFRYMRAYQLLAGQMGWAEDKILLPKAGQIIEINAQKQVIIK